MLKQHNRYPYSSLPSRAQYEWPDGKKLAVYVAMNIEAFSYGEGTVSYTHLRAHETR